MMGPCPSKEPTGAGDALTLDPTRRTVPLLGQTYVAQQPSRDQTPGGLLNPASTSMRVTLTFP